MRITSNNYPNLISSDINKSPQTTMQQRLEMLSTPSKPIENNENNFGFRDFIDIINPLQHIPIVSSIYRKITGDEIGSVARVAGGGLFGGVIGAVAGVVESAFKVMTGKDIGEHAFALATNNQFSESEADSKAETQKQATTAYNDTQPLINDGFFPLNADTDIENSFMSLNRGEKTFPITREVANRVFELNAIKQLDMNYIPQTMALNMAENTLETSKVSHIKKDNKESLDFWSKPVYSNISASNAFIASSFNNEI